MVPRSLFGLLALVLLPGILCAETAAPRPPIVNDTALKIELLATLPGVEACTTVCGAPDGSFYVGNDARDGRLATSDPVNQIVRFSSMGADKKRTVFADKIYSPAGSAWHDGYLYVLHDPLLTRFRDTDGDGIADVREDLITNLGIPPNEGLNDHVVSGFTLGMDGFFYISVGDRGIFGAKSVKDGSTITMRGGGIIRCRPDGTQLEIFSTGTRNHLEVNLDAEDNAFTRDNTDDGNGWWTRLTHHIQGGYYGYPYDFRSAPNYGVVQPSQQTLDAIKQHGGAATVDSGLLMVDGRTVPPVVESQKPPASPSASGLSTINSQPSTFLPAMADFGGGSPTGGLCYLSDGLPEQYRGKHFFSEWGKAGIFVTEVARDGATFRLVSDTKLVEPEKGGDFRPMQLSVAADGSLLIADWGYGGWKSPRVAGAVWRLSWPEAKIAPRLKDESKATLEELLAALGHPDRDQRLRAEAALLSGRVGVSPAGLGVPPKRTSDRADNATSPSTAPSSVSGTPKDRPGGTPEPAGGTPTLPGRLAAIVQDENAPTVQRIHALWTLARLALPDQTPAAAGAPSLQAATAAGTPPLQTPTAVGAPSLQPGGLADISRGSSEATTPGNATPGIRPGGAAEGNVAGSGSSAPAGAGAGVDGKPRVSPGANLLQPSGLAELLRDKNSAVRLQAARVIGTTFNFNTPENTRIEADQATSPALIRALGDSDPAVRRATLAALARVPNPSPAVGAPIVAALLDSDQWVRFTARGAARIHGWEAMDRVLAGTDDQAKDAVWQALDRAAGNDQALQVVLLRESKSSAASTRARAVAALGKIAYQPAPYDGHWWGTQPVKSPPPLNSVPWAGTPAALAALTAALADADARVRLAAAKAFTQFVMPTAASVSPARAAALSAPAPKSSELATILPAPKLSSARSHLVTASSTPVGGVFDPCQRLSWRLSMAFSTPASGFSIPCQRLLAPLSAAFCAPVSGFIPPCQDLFAACQRLFHPLSIDDSRAGDADRGQKAVFWGPGGVFRAGMGVFEQSAILASGQKATLLAAVAIPAEPKAAAGAETGDPGLDQAVASALTALRSRLTAETEPAVRRQLIEALGVQKDAGAVDVFRQIALDETADPEFRDTAIGAVVNIGGDEARKVIAQLASASLSPAATRQIITAAGELKVLEAAPALIAHLRDESPGNREFAARSLQQLGPKSGAGEALIAALADKDGKAQAAAIDALGSFREKAALPALIALAEKKRSIKETINALANMPDESAIPVLVETLRDKNTSVRRNAIKALKLMREKSWPLVETLLASGRVPEELVPEIRNAFESGAITRWKMVGVFENVWDAQHPPEKEMLALRLPATESPTGNEQIHPDAAALKAVLAHKYHNAEGAEVGWMDVTGDGAEGRVDLEKVFKTSAMVCAYAFTEIDAPEAADAKLFTSADDEIAVWLNGRQVLNVPGNHGYEPDKNETPLHFAAGKNQLFVKIGNKSGPWVFHARIPGFDNGKFIKSKELPPDEKQRAFALATKPDGSYANAGSPSRGEKLFFDKGGPLGGICSTCHAVKGVGGQVGPDLSLIAANYKRPDLITSIHEPSKTIALGFEQFLVETKDGGAFAGAIRQETADALTIVGADAQPHLVTKADVKTKTAVPLSIMPQGLTLGLKPEEFADLLAYLETLK